MASPLVTLSAERLALEQRKALEAEAAQRAEGRAIRRLFWQCVALTFTGVPIYGYAFGIADNRQAQVVAAAGFFVSYAFPFFRWLHFQVSRSESFR